jgi:Tol biopolymer transport system component
MPLHVGARIGSYEVLAPLGAGGMGEVYRARDTRLSRDVAIKVIPDVFAADHDRVARFQREATLLAALNHSHIAQVYGFEESNGVRALVMEFVEGGTLADRIASGPLPIEDALGIARQMAEALEAAHTLAIVHRDLKPANIKLTADGTVKVLDFGLAKALEPAVTQGASVSISPTLSVHATQAGIILGTAAYMSPEQARGKTADTRADIWAFGVVLFEMLAGRRPFEGDEISDTLAAVLKSEPAWHLLPTDLHPAVHRLLRRCLQKDRRERLQHIGDARLEIDEARRDGSVTSAPVPHMRRERVAWASAIVLAIALAAALTARRSPPIVELPQMRLEIAAGAFAFPGQVAISPDGRTLAYVNAGPRGRQLWVRALDGSVPRPIPGSDGGEYPFWSPDARAIGFFANNKLKTVDLEGGEPRLLANVITPAGGSWNRDGIILYVPNDGAGVMSVPAAGGEPTSVTPRRQPLLATRLPQFLPDGRHFLFFVARGSEPSGIYIGELGSDVIRRLLSADRPAVYGSGHVWFVRDYTLFAQQFDASSQTLSGPIHRIDNVGIGLVSAAVSASLNGPIVYRGESGDTRRRLEWFDRTGKALGSVGQVGAFVSNPTLSRDGRYVIVQRTVQENIDLWLIDLARSATERLTDQPGIDSMPVWSPDGNRVIYNSIAPNAGPQAILRIDRTAPPQSLGLHRDGGRGVSIVCDWSPDGQRILYKHTDANLGTTDLWSVRLTEPEERTPIAVTPADERDGQFSPDGKWVAYESDETGQPQIYLQPFPGPGAKVPLTTQGGTQVRWRADGKEIFYIAPDENVMAVAIDTAAGRSGLGVPEVLFKTSIAPMRTISRQQYVVSLDGMRFLIVTSDQPSTAPLTLLINWRPPAKP